MPTDLAHHLLHKSLGDLAGSTPHCSACRRAPVPGELLNVYDDGRTLCALCVAELPEPEREPVRRERVRAGRRRLAVVPRAA